MSAPKWLSLDLALSPQHGWMLSVKAGNQIAGCLCCTHERDKGELRLFYIFGTMVLFHTKAWIL